MILDGFKKYNSLLPQNNFNSDWHSTTPGWHSSSLKTIWFWITFKKLSKSHILPDLSLILIGSKNKSPCFHRSILIQIDSPLPHDDTQVVSRQSDVELQNKSSPNLTFYLTCLWFLMALKIKVPASTDQFQFRLTVHYPMMTLKQFQDNLIFYCIIKALQISYSTSSVCDFG